VKIWHAGVAALLLVVCGSPAESAPPARVHATRRPVHHHAKRRKLVHAAGWAGAGAAASHFAGPIGSVAVGATKYRHDLKKNWHTRKQAMVKIGAPLAAGAIAGPIGTAGYEAYDHRHWIKRHLFAKRHHARQGHHRTHRARRRHPIPPRRRSRRRP